MKVLGKLNLNIKKVSSPQQKSEICESLLRSLPLWFGIESAIQDYVNDVQEMDTWSAEVEGKSVGFISINKHNRFTAEIHVMAVLEQYHGQSIGTKLIEVVERALVSEGFRFLQVKTLSESRPNVEYDKTRKFYLKYGFTPVEEFKTLWGAANPCLLLIKALNESSKNNMPITGINHVTLTVNDLEKSFEFYHDVLGLKPLSKIEGKSAYFLTGSDWIVLVEDANKTKDKGYSHLAFTVTSETFVSVAQKIQSSGSKIWQENKSEGESLYFEDPSGNKLEIHIGSWQSRINSLIEKPTEKLIVYDLGGNL